MAAKKKAAPKKKGKRTPKLAPSTVKRGLAATEVALPIDHPDIAGVVELVRQAGGAPLGAYREPLGGRPLLLASLPFSAVQPTVRAPAVPPERPLTVIGVPDGHVP